MLSVPQDHLPLASEGSNVLVHEDWELHSDLFIPSLLLEDLCSIELALYCTALAAARIIPDVEESSTVSDVILHCTVLS